MVVLDELQQRVAKVAAEVGPSVVGIGQRRSAGSGVVIAPGRVLTNAHNIGGEEVTVTFGDGRTESGRPRGVDVDGDVAVLAVETGDVPAIPWREGNGTTIGLPVFALSNPGGHGLRVTFGLVSGTERSFSGPRGRRITGSVEHTAPLLPGSSGGPTVDVDGNFLGLNTNRLGEGFYLAIPADEELKGRIGALGRGEAPSRPRLGVAIAPPEVAKGLRRAVGLAEIDGLLVRDVEEDGPAAEAGVEEGDLLTSAGGRSLTSVEDLHGILEASTPGSTLELKVVRGAEERSVTVTVGGGTS
jgi:serine protease Do